MAQSKTELDAYLRGVLPLLDEEKIAQLLSKGAHVVDKVFDIAQTDEGLKSIIESIYEAGTNQTLINKLNGNKLLAAEGVTEFGDFYFNTEATKEKLVELAAEDEITKYDDPIPYWKKVVANLYWDVPAEHIFSIFTGFVSSILGDSSLPNNVDKIEGAYNYLRFQMDRAGIVTSDMQEIHSSVKEKLPGVCDGIGIGVSGEPEAIESIAEKLKEIGETKNKKNPYGFISGNLSITGMSWGSVIGYSGSSVAISGLCWNSYITTGVATTLTNDSTTSYVIWADGDSEETPT